MSEDDSASDSSSDLEDDRSDDDDQLLHGVCGEPYIGADTNPYECLVGKYIVKVFLTADDVERSGGRLSTTGSWTRACTTPFVSTGGVTTIFNHAENIKSPIRNLFVWCVNTTCKIRPRRGVVHRFALPNGVVNQHPGNKSKQGNGAYLRRGS